MKTFYDSDVTRIIPKNQSELLDYLLRVDCQSESPISYRANLYPAHYDDHTKIKHNYSILIVKIDRYKTDVNFPIIIADGVNTNTITTHYNSLEVFRSQLKDFFDYIDELGVKCEKEKTYNSTLKKLTPKPPKPKKEKPKKEEPTKTEPDKDAMGCRTYTKYYNGIPTLVRQYYYLNKEK